MCFQGRLCHLLAEDNTIPSPYAAGTFLKTELQKKQNKTNQNRDFFVIRKQKLSEGKGTCSREAWKCLRSGILGVLLLV